MKLSASSGATSSGLFVCCDLSDADPTGRSRMPYTCPAGTRKQYRGLVIQRANQCTNFAMMNANAAVASTVATIHLMIAASTAATSAFEAR